jgi:pimeloyl-ACP methyl ester carboxylesterase
MRLVTQTALITFALLVSLADTAYADGERTHAATGLVYDLLGEPKPGESVHFVVCLHGAGDNKDNFRSYADGAVSVMRERTRIYVNSPSREGWPGDAMGKVIDLTKDQQKEFKCRSTVLFGFSAGGYLSTRCMAQAPEVFDGMVINGATISLVWTQTRDQSEENGLFRFGPSFGRLLDARPDNIFMLKLTYWLSR